MGARGCATHMVELVVGNLSSIGLDSCAEGGLLASDRGRATTEQSRVQTNAKCSIAVEGGLQRQAS